MGWQLGKVNFLTGWFGGLVVWQLGIANFQTGWFRLGLRVWDRRESWLNFGTDWLVLASVFSWSLNRFSTASKFYNKLSTNIGKPS